MAETDRKDYLKQVAKDNREQALIWAEDKTDAQLLDALVEQRDIVDDITREAEEKAAREAEGHDSLEADDLLSETHTKENPEDPDAEAAKEAGQTDPVPSGSAEESGNEPEA